MFEEFETFKKNVYSYVDRAFSIVKAVELMHVLVYIINAGKSEVADECIGNVFSTV